jgi:toxin ParE1/3/4
VELVGAAKRYKCESAPLARKFLHSVRHAVIAVQSDPERFPFYDSSVRSCRVAGFPYRVIYEDLPDAIYIIAVAHLSREPGYWANRLS